MQEFPPLPLSIPPLTSSPHDLQPQAQDLRKINKNIRHPMDKQINWKTMCPCLQTCKVDNISSKSIKFTASEYPNI